ncbi:hypothetical protein BN190_2410013 [Clostridioides difficile T14]|nr:hypothetical protein BN187_1840005 [Clostridioides difficile E12]CCL91325.1 hypothetical protein BN190_2410013 [Clostridioides difficile T14]
MPIDTIVFIVKIIVPNKKELIILAVITFVFPYLEVNTTESAPDWYSPENTEAILIQTAIIVKISKSLANRKYSHP